MSKFFKVSKESGMSLGSIKVEQKKGDSSKKMPKNIVFIAFRIRILTTIQKKIFGESNFERNFLGFDLEKL